VGAKVLAVQRRAKVLLIEFDTNLTLMIHLKMTGQMVLVQAGGRRMAGGHPTNSMAAQLPDSSTRVVFTFAGGDVLYFNDQRKFGWMKLVPTAEVLHDTLVAKLGPEVDAVAFTFEYLSGQLQRRKGSPVKAVLLDQTVVSGVGNIYADETLHLAQIHPARRAGSLSAEETGRLYDALLTIMAAGIAHGGTSFAQYVNALGGAGDYLDQARVFRRQGQLCPECGAEIVKLRVAGRGTHICPICQVL
jgi:formamidopyrimidine-DNA glycosylase